MKGIRARWCAAAFLVMAACGGSTGAADDSGAVDTTATTAGFVSDNTIAADATATAAASASDDTGPVQTTTAASQADPSEPSNWDYPDDVGFVEIILLTPVEGVGLHPEFTWEPLDGTDLYMVVVSAPDGEPYWSWMGPGTSIHLGGEPQLVDGADGPELAPGMSWSVMATDAAGTVIGLSVQRPISP